VFLPPLPHLLRKVVIERCSLISALGLTSAPDTYGLANENAGFLLSMKCLVPEMSREEKKMSYLELRNRFR
jgi:hypothetical protein